MSEFDILDPGDYWDQIVHSSIRYDVYHLSGYHRVAAERSDGTPRLFLFRDGEDHIALPLMVRPIKMSGEPDVASIDATSVYGYAGPVSSREEWTREAIAVFHAKLKAALDDLGVCSVFSRLHPFIRQHVLVGGLGQVEAVGSTVFIDLSKTSSTQWSGYRKNLRYDIRKLRERGLVLVWDRDLKYLEAFHRMYRDTMDRVKADQWYYFPKSYFTRLFEELGRAVALFIVQDGDDPVAGGVFTNCCGIVQYHLGATKSEYAGLAPTKLLIDGVREWAIQQGASVFHLGGGVGTREDSLFRFKAGFSRERAVFSVWKWIVDEARYWDLVAQRGMNSEGTQGRSAMSFFPAYRA